MCCITETINASLLNSIYNNSTQTKAQKIIHEILKDEIKHGQMGWAHLAAESNKRDCSFIGKHLGEMLEISVKDEIFVPCTNIEQENSFDWGVMPVSLRLDQFIETIENVVFPGLEKFNIDTVKGKDWLRRKLA